MQFAALCRLLHIPTSPQLGKTQQAADGPSFDRAAGIDQVRPASDGLMVVSADITSDYLSSRAEDRLPDPDLANNDDKDRWLVDWDDRRSGDDAPRIYDRLTDPEATPTAVNVYLPVVRGVH